MVPTDMYKILNFDESFDPFLGFQDYIYKDGFREGDKNPQTHHLDTSQGLINSSLEVSI